MVGWSSMASAICSAIWRLSARPSATAAKRASASARSLGLAPMVFWSSPWSVSWSGCSSVLPGTWSVVARASVSCRCSSVQPLAAPPGVFENRRGESHRGFESLLLRQRHRSAGSPCVRGVVATNSLRRARGGTGDDATELHERAAGAARALPGCGWPVVLAARVLASGNDAAKRHDCAAGAARALPGCGWQRVLALRWWRMVAMRPKGTNVRLAPPAPSRAAVGGGSTRTVRGWLAALRSSVAWPGRRADPASFRALAAGHHGPARAPR
jgi:hypothetical protein